MAKRTFAFVAVFAALLSVTLSVQAQESLTDYYWSGGASDNLYYTIGNWKLDDTHSASTPLNDNDSSTDNTIRLNLYGNQNLNISLNYTHLGSNVKKLIIGGGTYTTKLTRSSTGTLTVAANKSIEIVNNGTLQVDSTLFLNANAALSVKDNGTFALKGFETAGTFDYSSSKDFRIADGVDAIVKITGGEATINADTHVGIGYQTGTINQSGGNVTFYKNLNLGWVNTSDGSGHYILSGGTLTTKANAGLWNNYNNGAANTFTMTGGTANFQQTGESFAIGANNNANIVKNVFNLYSGTVNATDTFAIKHSGTLKVAQNAVEDPETHEVTVTGGDGVLNAKGITLTTGGILDMSSGTINVGESGITSSDGSYSIALSGGTFGTYGASWSSALTASIASGSAVTFNPDSGKTITWSGVLKDAGGVTKTGAGTLTLSGANTYSGGTTISAGTLKLNGSTATLGAGAVTIAENAALEISGAPRGLHSVTSLSGSGNINITGTGNSFLSLANANAQDYNGTINVTGKLHIGYQDSNNKDRYTNLNLPNATVSLSTSGAQLALDQDDNYQDTTTLTIKTLNGVAGTYVRAGGQALYFDPPGYSTITVGDGVFQGVIGTNTTSYPCFNNISLIKNTTGTLTLSGANTYTGATTIETGTINVDNGGSLTGTTNLIVGSSGESLLDVKQGGSVTVNGGSTVGSDGKGTILVENGGSFVSTGNILLAEKTSNTGTITVQNGGYLKSQDIQVGSMGNAVVDNYGTIEVVDTVKIGRDGDSNTGVVNVYEGATLTATTIFPGVTMPGTLNINGGSVTVTNGVALHGRGTNATGTVTITNGGSLTTPFLQLGNVNFTTYAVDTTITLDDGTLSVVNVTYPRDGSHTNNVNATVNLGKGTVITGANTGVESIWWAAVPVNLTYANGTDIQVDNGKTAKFNSPVSGAGGLNKTGDGTLILNGINTYSGKTTISAGTLEISNNFTSSSGLAGSGTLKLSGSEKDYYFGDASGFTGTVQVFDNTISTKSRVRLVVGPDGTTPPNTDLSNATVDINGRKVSNNEYFSEIAFTKACSLSIGTLNGNEYSRFLSIDRNTTAGTTTTYANLIVSNGTYAGQIGRNDTNDNSTTAFVNHINFVKADDGTADGGKLTLSNKYMYYKGTTTIEGGTLEFTNNLSGNNYQYFARSTALKGSGNLDFVGNNWTVFSIDTTDTTTPQEFSGTVNVSGSIMLTKEGLGAARDLNLGNATINVKSTGLIGLYGHTDTAVSNLTAKELNVESGGVIRICKHDPGSAFGTLTAGRGLISGTLGQENSVWNQVNLVKVSDGSETGGRLTISGNNYYNGTTTVSGGVLELTGDAVVANGPVSIGANGTLVYNVDGQDKYLEITEDNANAIFGAGKIIKTGEGTLKIYSDAENMIDVQSLTVSSGRVDIKEYFNGKLIVDSEGTFSPGNSVGTLTIDNFTVGETTYGGGFILNEAGAELLMEIGGATPDLNDGLIVNGDITFKDGSIITLVNNSNLGRGESFTAILSANNSSTLDVLSHIQTTDFTELKYLQITDGTYGAVYAITGRTFNANEVPEPSTWALLILGAAGLMYWRKRK